MLEQKEIIAFVLLDCNILSQRVSFLRAEILM